MGSAGRVPAAPCRSPRLRAPEPAADRRRRPADPEPQRRAAVGTDTRQRDPGLGSGTGIDAHGDLIYAAANDQTVSSLAAILMAPARSGPCSSTSTPTGDVQLLRPAGRRTSQQPAAGHDPAGDPQPLPRRPGFLRRLPAVTLPSCSERI